MGVPVVAAENGLRPPSVVNFTAGDSADLERKLLSVLGDLEGARARVVRPIPGRNMEEEIGLLVSAATRKGTRKGLGAS